MRAGPRQDDREGESTAWSTTSSRRCSARYGQGWAEDTDANIRFAIEAERLVADLDDVHLIGEPELDEHHVTLQFWVDRPIADLMTADQVAFDIFARISIEIFYAERRFVEGAIVYPFVTGIVPAWTQSARWCSPAHTRPSSPSASGSGWLADLRYHA